ncbi:MAG: extracellular solute-binding protein [Clostridia bacterium]|nr:extracellular solute-binding protein [Clostridia bacterium]
MKRNSTRILALALSLLMVLAALSAVSVAEEKQKITMLFSAGGSGKAITAAAQRFTAETGIEAEVLLFSLNEVYEKQVLSLSNGNNDIDIVAINDPWLPLLSEYLDPIEMDQEKLSAFIPGMLNTFAIDGVNYGIPVRMGGDIIAYRRDVVEALGVDPASLKTWEDVYQLALKMTDRENGKYGWAMGLVEPSNVVKAWYEYLISFGGYIVNEAGDGLGLTRPESIAATKMFVKFVQDCCPPDVLSYAFNDQIDAMKTGNVDMGLLWTSRYPSVNAEGTEGYGQWDVLPIIPETGVACVDGWAVGISKYSDHKEAAKAFVEYIGSYDEQLRLAVENSNSPTIASIYDAPEYLAVVPQAANMNAALEVAVPRPQQMYFNEMQEEIALYVKLACLGDMTVEDAMAACEANCLEILEMYEE